jgi:hypothetical protein
MLVRLEKQQIDSIIQNDSAISSLIRAAVGNSEEGHFEFQLYRGVDQSIVDRFSNVLKKYKFQLSNQNKPNVQLSFSVEPEPIPVVIPEPVVEVVVIEEPVIEAPIPEMVVETIVELDVEQEEQPKKKVRK